MNTLAAELAEMRAAWGARGSSPGDDWFPKPPEWAWRDPIFRGDAAERLWRHGEVEWGWLLKAHSVAWAAGTEVGPGAVLYSDDVVVREDVTHLANVARRIWAVREKPDVRYGLRAFNAWAADDTPHSAERGVPSAFTEGRVVWTSAVLVHRAQLPGGFLRDSLVAIVRDPRHQVDGVSLAPLRFWSPKRVALWTADPS